MNNRTVRLFPKAAARSASCPCPQIRSPAITDSICSTKGERPVATASVQVVDAHFRKQNVVIGQSIAELKPSPGETETVTAFRNAVSDVRLLV